MVVQDKSGWKGFPLGMVHDGAETFVVVRWTERSDGEPCDFVSAVEIEEIELIFNKCDKIHAIRKLVQS